MLSNLLIISTFAIVALAQTFPPSKIFTENIEFNSLSSNGAPQSYEASFGSKFDLTPNIGLAWTGVDNPADTTSTYFGWQFDVSNANQNGVTFTLSVMNSFNSIKMKYMATQGDRLQVFYLQVSNSSTYIPVKPVSFDYDSRVAFDPDNLPSKVFVGAFLSSLLGYNQATMQVSVNVYDPSGPQQQFRTALDVADLRGAGKTFTDDGNVMIKMGAAHPITMQFTLFLHRVSLPSESPPSNGYYYYRASTSVSGTSSSLFNTSNPDTNPLPIGTGQKIIGVFGSTSFWVGQNPYANMNIAINFTGIDTGQVDALGYTQIYPNFVAVFYLYDCDALCGTCSGPFSDQCFTCTNGYPPLNGVCCPSGCSSCSSSTVCTACDLHSFRIATPDASDQCPCFPKFYENASGKCVQCPATCATCQLSGGSVVCLTCSCAQHREFNNGVCDCKLGFAPDTVTQGPYCLKTPAN